MSTITFWSCKVMNSPVTLFNAYMIRISVSLYHPHSHNLPMHAALSKGLLLTILNEAVVVTDDKGVLSYM